MIWQGQLWAFVEEGGEFIILRNKDKKIVVPCSAETIQEILEAVE